ncbi:hypothetical protein JTB14_028617 [Gonioctena quinquepunctata]|nr:hypothetical protein JTB14_028617 [Gonioctena quinquepunctata]
METFLDIFSCLICLGDILGNSTNLVQCMNGHTICEDCSIRCQNCPVCRVPYDAGVIRNLLMEEMRDVLVRFFGIPQEEIPTNSDEDFHWQATTMILIPLSLSIWTSICREWKSITLKPRHHQSPKTFSARQVYSGMGTNIRSITGFVRGDP